MALPGGYVCHVLKFDSPNVSILRSCIDDVVGTWLARDPECADLKSEINQNLVSKFWPKDYSNFCISAFAALVRQAGALRAATRRSAIFFFFFFNQGRRQLACRCSLRSGHELVFESAAAAVAARPAAAAAAVAVVGLRAFFHRQTAAQSFS